MKENYKLFMSMVEKIADLPSRNMLTKSDILIEPFRLMQNKEIEIYYAPCDYINEEARVAVIGITPGWQQMEIAYRFARDGIKRGFSPVEVSRLAKHHASFAGTMRTNLIKMLDGIGIAESLNLNSCASLFSDNRKMLHTTSALRYPVFVDGKNYTGHKPKPLNTSELRKYIDELLVDELQKMETTFLIPLGKSVSTILEYLIDSKKIERERCCLGFPHPSGANAHRVKQFEERKKIMKQKAMAWFL